MDTFLAQTIQPVDTASSVKPIYREDLTWVWPFVVGVVLYTLAFAGIKYGLDGLKDRVNKLEKVEQSEFEVINKRIDKSEQAVEKILDKIEQNKSEAQQQLASTLEKHERIMKEWFIEVFGGLKELVAQGDRRIEDKLDNNLQSLKSQLDRQGHELRYGPRRYKEEE